MLLLRCLYVWLALSVADIKNVAWVWPLFMFMFELFADIIPFSIFSYLLWKQVRHLCQVHKRN